LFADYITLALLPLLLLLLSIGVCCSVYRLLARAAAQRYRANKLIITL